MEKDPVIEEVENNVEEVEQTTEVSEEVQKETKEDAQEKIENPKEDTEIENDNLPKGIKKRFATLTKRNKLYESEIDELKQRLSKYEGYFEEKRREVTRDDFSNEKDYIEYMVQQAHTKNIVEPQRQYQEQVKQQQLRLLEWEERIASQFNDVDDYRETVSKLEGDASEEVIGAIMSSEVGPKISYYLAQNPEQADRLFEMKGSRLEREILKLEIKLEDKEFGVQPKRTTSSAPKPISKPTGTVTLNSKGSSDMNEWASQFMRSYREKY